MQLDWYQEGGRDLRAERVGGLLSAVSLLLVCSKHSYDEPLDAGHQVVVCPLPCFKPIRKIYLGFAVKCSGLSYQLIGDVVPFFGGCRGGAVSDMLFRSMPLYLGNFDRRRTFGEDGSPNSLPYVSIFFASSNGASLVW